MVSYHQRNTGHQYRHSSVPGRFVTVPADSRPALVSRSGIRISIEDGFNEGRCLIITVFSDGSRDDQRREENGPDGFRIGRVNAVPRAVQPEDVRPLYRLVKLMELLFGDRTHPVEVRGHTPSATQ